MSRDLGISSTNDVPYYFLSYNSEDQDRVAPYAAIIERYAIPVWYDNGIDVGTKWEQTIAEKMSSCDAVLMFLSKNIFNKSESYVHKEFEMAVRYFKKKVIIVLLDEIKAEDVPPKYVSWWIDVTHLQCIESYKFTSIPACVEKISEAVGYSINKSGFISKLKNNFDSLDDSEKLKIAENYVNTIIRSNELLVRAKSVIEFINYGLISTSKDGTPFISKASGSASLTIDGRFFETNEVTCFHAPNFDADIIQIIRDNEIIYVIGGVMDAYHEEMVYDEINDLLFVIFTSISRTEMSKHMEDNSHNADFYDGAIVIEQPTTKAICHRFNDIIKSKRQPW